MNIRLSRASRNVSNLWRSTPIAHFSRIETSKDYYKILGVSQQSKPTDIKSAFFKLAKKYHPDTNPTAGEKFKEINEAYQTLSDSIKKGDYDTAMASKANNNYSSSQQHPGDDSNMFRRSAQQQQQQNQYEYHQRPREADDKFHYYWEAQNPKGGDAQRAYQQYQQQNYQYQRQKEQARKADEGRMNDGMSDFIRGIYEQQQQDQQRQQPRGRVHPTNPYQFEEVQRNTQQTMWDKYDLESQKFHHAQMQEKYREELRRQEEFQQWQKQKDEMFMREVDQQMQQMKDKVANVGKTVEKVASSAEQLAKDLGSKVVSFFKKK